MEEVFAGFVSGFLLALTSTPLVAVYLLRLRTGSDVVARLVPPESSVSALVFIIHGGLILSWTALGILLGLVLYAMRDEAAAAGSANAPFTLLVAGLTVALVAPVAIVSRDLRRWAIASGVLMFVVFGWLMPYLARWSDFGSA